MEFLLFFAVTSSNIDESLSVFTLSERELFSLIFIAAQCEH